MEYCYTLNLDTNTWKRHVIAAPSGTVLQRSRHSGMHYIQIAVKN